MRMSPLPVGLASAVLLLLVVCGCPRQTEPPSPPASGTPQVAAPTTPDAGATSTAPAAQAAEPRTDKGTGTQWPAFRGPNADGIGLDTGINKDWGKRSPRTLWKVPMRDGGFSGPSLAAGKVFIIYHEGDQDVVRALALATGEEVWRFPYKDTNQANYGYARSTPTYADGKLYTLSRLGLLHCLDAESGQMLWMRDLVNELGGQRPKWDYAASPLVDGKAVVVCPGGKSAVAALDRSSGALLWAGGPGGPPGYATPVIATLGGRRQYVIFAAAGLCGVSSEGGAALWQLPWKTEYDVNAATPIPIENFVFATSGYGVGCAIAKISGSSAQITWKSPEIQAHFNTPVYVGGFLYGIGDPGNLVCLNPQDGKAVWKKDGFEKGGVACVDGVILAVDGKGGDVVMVAASPNAYQELGRINPLGGQSWTAPVVADGKLLVRNTKALAAVDLM